MRKSYWIALLFLLAVALWLISGQFSAYREEPPAAEAGAEFAAGKLRVRVKESQASRITGEVVIPGNTAPLRSVTAKAEVSGRVVAVPGRRGAPVKAGAVLVRLDPSDREARLAEARALVRQRELEYEGARQLRAKGLQAEARLAEAGSELESARAQMKAAQLELERTRIEAPFDGVLDERPVEVGDYVSPGDPVAKVVQLNPFIVTGPASERQVGGLQLGAPGRALLINGASREGFIRYIAATADPATRTFKVELEVPNPEGVRFAGTTAEIHIPLPPVIAHKVPPSVLSLDAAGTIGVKTVNGDGVVEFHEAEVVKADPDWLWLGGLPESIRLIVAGQGYVQEGDEVLAVSSD